MPIAGRSKTRRIVTGILVASLVAVAGPAAAQSLKPGKNYDPAKIAQATKLYTDYRAGRLGAQGQQYWAAFQSARSAARANVNALVAGGNVGAGHCTATCQTVLVVNGGSVYFEGEGTVSSPSACADAAEAFCGSAVSTFLHHWNCK